MFMVEICSELHWGCPEEGYLTHWVKIYECKLRGKNYFLKISVEGHLGGSVG